MIIGEMTGMVEEEMTGMVAGGMITGETIVPLVIMEEMIGGETVMDHGEMMVTEEMIVIMVEKMTGIAGMIVEMIGEVLGEMTEMIEEEMIVSLLWKARPRSRPSL